MGTEMSNDQSVAGFRGKPLTDILRVDHIGADDTMKRPPAHPLKAALRYHPFLSLHLAQAIRQSLSDPRPNLPG